MADPAPVKVPASQIKAYLKSQHGLRTSGPTADAINEQVRELLDQAAARAKASGKATVSPHHL